MVISSLLLHPLRLHVPAVLVQDQVRDLAILLHERDLGVGHLEEELRLRLREDLDLPLSGRLGDEPISLAA